MAVSSFKLPSLLNGAHVIGATDAMGNLVVTAKVLSELDIIELFGRFVDMAEINQRCRFICSSSHPDRVEAVFELGVADRGGFSKRSITVVSQMSFLLPSQEALGADRPPWFLSIYNIFSSHGENSPDKLLSRAYDAVLLRAQIKERAHLNVADREAISYRLDNHVIIREMYDAMSEQDRTAQSTTITEEVVTYASDQEKNNLYFEKKLKELKGSNKLSYSKISLKKQGAVGEEEDYNLSSNWKLKQRVIYQDGGSSEIFSQEKNTSFCENIGSEAKRFAIRYPENQAAAEAHLFRRLFQMQEQRRLEMQNEIIGELPSEADKKSTAFQNILEGMLSQEGIFHYLHRHLVERIDTFFQDFLESTMT